MLYDHCQVFKSFQEEGSTVRKVEKAKRERSPGYLPSHWTFTLSSLSKLSHSSPNQFYFDTITNIFNSSCSGIPEFPLF